MQSRRDVYETSYAFDDPYRVDNYNHNFPRDICRFQDRRNDFKYTFVLINLMRPTLADASRPEADRKRVKK